MQNNPQGAFGRLSCDKDGIFCRFQGRARSRTGFFAPSLGTVIFDDHDITGRKPHQTVRAGIARTFQNIRLWATMSPVENVMVGQHSRMKTGLVGSIQLGRPTPYRSRRADGSGQAAKRHAQS